MGGRIRDQQKLTIFSCAIIGLAALTSACNACSAEAGEAIPRDALQYRDDLTREARYVWGMDAPIAAMGAQIATESNWRATVCSAFACGLSQFTTSTAGWIAGVYPRLGPPDVMNPRWALRAMVQFDKHLYDAVKRFKNGCHRYAFMLSDYNGGSGRRIARQAKSKDPADYFATSIINPGISASNQAENSAYPMRILFRWQPVYAPWGPTVFCGVPFQAVS